MVTLADLLFPCRPVGDVPAEQAPVGHPEEEPAVERRVEHHAGGGPGSARGRPGRCVCALQAWRTEIQEQGTAA